MLVQLYFFHEKKIYLKLARSSCALFIYYTFIEANEINNFHFPCRSLHFEIVINCPIAFPSRWVKYSSCRAPLAVAQSMPGPLDSHGDFNLSRLILIKSPHPHTSSPFVRWRARQANYRQSKPREDASDPMKIRGLSCCWMKAEWKL